MMQNTKLINDLFLKFHMAHGKKFMDFFNADLDFIEISKVFWGNQLSEFSEERLSVAFDDSLNEINGMPSLDQFKKLCLRKKEVKAACHRILTIESNETKRNPENIKKANAMIESLKNKFKKEFENE